MQVRLVTAAAGVAAIVATSMLSGCGAGQVAETAEITAAVPGGNATVKVPAALNPNSAILVQNAIVDYNGPAGYTKGDDVPLSIQVINQTPFPVTVVPGTVTITRAGNTEGSVPAGTLGWTDARHQAEKNAPTPAPTPTPSGSGKPSKPKPSGSPSELPTPTPAPTPAALPDLRIASADALMLTAANGQYLQISGLIGDLKPGDLVTVTLDFKVDPSQETDELGKPTGRAITDYPATVVLPVAPPLSPAPREGADG